MTMGYRRQELVIPQCRGVGYAVGPGRRGDGDIHASHAQCRPDESLLAALVTRGMPERFLHLQTNRHRLPSQPRLEPLD